jgi:TetR/AcrR family transcriptional repressor of mexJK operon
VATRQTRGEQRDLDRGGGRSARKRQAIMEAATTLFLRDGYRSTGMDQVAADAAVSKQTVYKHFEDKEALFREIVLGVTANSERIISELTSVLRACAVVTLADLRTVLTDLARRYIDGVLRPDVLSLRRLIISEAEHFPDLARTYFEQAPVRAIDVIADALTTYESQGLLRVEDPRLAAGHFAYLVLGIPLDRAQFCPADRLPRTERNRLATQGVRVFLAAYQPALSPPPIGNGTQCTTSPDEEPRPTGSPASLV